MTPYKITVNIPVKSGQLEKHFWITSDPGQVKFHQKLVGKEKTIGGEKYVQVVSVEPIE